VSAAVPLTDDDVPAWWTALDLPGIVDLHVHFMPQRVLDKVWAYFDSAGPLTGRTWPIAYRWPEQQRLSHLRELGVRAFGALVYPHKPAMAAWLNSWAVHFAAAHKDVVHTATFFPEDSAVEYVAKALDDGARMFKAHLQVGGYDPRDPLLDPAWGLIAEAGVPAIVHCGDGPIPGAHTGMDIFAEVLERHPLLTAVLAHAGLPEYERALGLLERFPRVHLDTTMVGTAYTEQFAPLPRDWPSRLVDVADRVALGTDFPNIPYAYAHQLSALVRLDLGDDWLRAVCHDNAARLFGLSTKKDATG
jgi:uncharacterized protein